MHSLKHAHATVSISTLSRDSAARGSKSVDAPVGDASALDQSNSLKLGQSSKLGDAGVSQVAAASQINISDSAAGFRQRLDRRVCDPSAVSEMNIM